MYGLLFSLLAGCALGPDFEPPPIDLPARWSAPQALPAATQENAALLATWWRAFEDPALTSLVERALSANLDLQLATARIRQTRAARGIAAAGLGPALDSSAAYQRRRTGSDSRGALTTHLYQAGLDAGWEIDIFGGVRRGVEAADADIAAASANRQDVGVTLVAEVALSYIELRALQQRIVIAQRNLSAQQHTGEITRQRFESGFASRLEVVNAEAQVATTAAQIPLLEDQARQSIHGLGVLLGREPGALLEELAPTAPIPAARPCVAAGIPSDLLRQRPDIRQAEAEAHAATARIGVATADLFPRFTIGGSVGVQADTPSALWDPISRFWSLGPSVSWPIFSSGKIRSAIEVQQALQEQALIAYRQVVLAALKEVEDALSAMLGEQQRHQELIRAVAANRQAVELAMALYTAGEIDFLNVLIDQRALLNAEDALAQSQRTLCTNCIALYKALGGGWSSEVR